MRFVTLTLLVAALLIPSAKTLLAVTITDQFQVTISAHISDDDEEEGSVTQGGGGASTLYLPSLTPTFPPVSPFPLPSLCGVADLNCDTVVDLTDFSILLYWADRANHPAYVDLNSDRNIDIYDFSIMAYHWNV